MNRLAIAMCLTLALGLGTSTTESADAAMDTVTLSVSGPKSAKIGSQITFKFKLGKASVGRCYVYLGGKGIIGSSRISGTSTQVKVKHANPGTYSFICTGSGSWRTEFVYSRVQFS